MITRTISGNRPPTGFLITLWTLTILFLLIAVSAGIAAWRLRSSVGEEADGLKRRGQATQSGCLVAGGVPSLLLGVFLLVWAVQVT